MITTTIESHGYGDTGIYADRVTRVLKKRYRLEEIAEQKNIENIYVSVWNFEHRSVSVYLDGKHYDFKKLEWLKNRLPKKQIKKSIWQKIKEILLCM